MAHEPQKKYMATLKKFEFRVKPEIFEDFKNRCEGIGSNPTAEIKKFINQFLGGNKMNGFELKNKLEDLTEEEIESGTKALTIAEDIFNTRYSSSEGNDVVTELLNNNFIYDGEDYRKTGYFEDGSNVADFAEQALLIKQVNDYIFWADEMKELFK